MTVRREASISGTFIYTQTWTVDNRLASVIKASLAGTVLAVTQYAYDGDGVRIRKTDPDGTTLYIGLTEVTLNYTPPTLTGNTGVSADGFDLRKAATTYVWDAGAFDGAHAITQTGFVQTRVDTRYSGHRMFGLSNVDADVSFCSMRHAWFLAKGGGLWVYENCAAVYTSTLTYGVNDQIRIEVEGGYVRYKIQPGGGGGWQTLFTSTQPVTAPLYFDAAFLTLGSTLKDIRFVSGSTAAPSVNRTYYTFGGARVAMRDGAGAALVYLHGDHLGSASLATSMTGTVLSQQRYAPYGEIRWSSGAGMPTDFTFTGQRAGPPGYVGSLTDYVARFYSPALGRVVSADTIVPGAGNSQAYNRYSYVQNSPLGRIDPSGHEDCSTDACWQSEWAWKNRWYEARGAFWENGGWNRQGLANFRDEGILRETLGEAGISFLNGWNPVAFGLSKWSLEEMRLVGQGAVALANKVGGLSHLRNLLGGNTILQRANISSFVSAYVGFGDFQIPGAFQNVVTFLNGAFNPGVFAVGLTTHELAHVIDFRCGECISGKLPFEKDEKAFLGAYGSKSRREGFGEAVAMWVLDSENGNPYRPLRGLAQVAFPGNLRTFLESALVVHP